MVLKARAGENNRIGHGLLPLLSIMKRE
jgi:hypothetical protein